MILCFFLFETSVISLGEECCNRISDATFLIVFRSNSGSILLSFRDMINDGQRTDGGRTDVGNYRISGL